MSPGSGGHLDIHACLRSHCSATQVDVKNCSHPHAGSSLPALLYMPMSHHISSAASIHVPCNASIRWKPCPCVVCVCLPRNKLRDADAAMMGHRGRAQEAGEKLPMYKCVQPQHLSLCIDGRAACLHAHLLVITPVASVPRWRTVDPAGDQFFVGVACTLAAVANQRDSTPVPADLETCYPVVSFCMKSADRVLQACMRHWADQPGAAEQAHGRRASGMLVVAAGRLSSGPCGSWRS